MAEDNQKETKLTFAILSSCNVTLEKGTQQTATARLSRA